MIAWVVTTVLSAMLAPRPKMQEAPPGQIGDKDIPMASQDAPIPVLFGTRLITQPNVVWWGDLRVVPIRKSSGGKKG
ncbi:hypothetical protein [Acidithiobacillus sp.]|uniref:hypothetical protein n=1 Tax=Acidithiobacillus sp. TaxID=1872118 RepID=UPI00258BB6DD|nr:hypothetical protein [Acidithiobacillus sp.]